MSGVGDNNDDKGLPLDVEETDVAIYKGKGGNPVLE